MSCGDCSDPVPRPHDCNRPLDPVLAFSNPSGPEAAHGEFGQDHVGGLLAVPFLAGVIPTAENLALAFWRQLDGPLGEGRLRSLRLVESENNSVEVTR